MGYKILNKDDIIRESDEIDADNWSNKFRWEKVLENCPHMIGKSPNNPRFLKNPLYRRKIK